MRDPAGRPGGGSSDPGVFKMILAFVLLVVLFQLVSSWFTSPSSGQEIDFTSFSRLVKEGRIKSAEISGALISWKDGENRYFTVLPLDGQYEIVTALQTGGAKVKILSTNPSFLSQILSWSPLILIAVFFFLLMGRLSQNSSGLRFGRSRAKLLQNNQKKITFKEVAGVEEAKEELEEVVAFLKTPAKFQQLGARIPKGVLLIGPPGTGKTLLARAVAGEANTPFFTISGSDFVEMFVGVGASRVRALFEQGKKNAPCIIFIDELDAVGRHRGAGLGGGHDEREQTLNQMLVEMDGFEANSGVIIMAATNRPDILDPALLRAGRFDRQVVVNLPDIKGREAILKIHAQKIPLDSGVDLAIIARGTPGFSGAALENLVNEAALNAARHQRQTVSAADFETAKDKVLMGKERRSFVMTEKDKKITAYHEAGHALVAYYIPQADPLHKVTIIPRGLALGLTQQLPEQDKISYSKEFLESQIAILLGGRCAEKIFLNTETTGAANDIEVATERARQMVTEWGMSRLGPIALGKTGRHVFLGREIAQHRNFSEQTAIRIDEEIENFIVEGQKQALAIINEHYAELERLALALLEHETLEAGEIQKALTGQPIK